MSAAAPSRLEPLFRRVTDAGITYLGTAKLAVLATTCQEALVAAPNGLIVEVGVALGGSAIVLAALKPPSSYLELYDTFEGIPEPGQQDGPDAHQRFATIQTGRSHGIKGGRYYGYETELRALVTSNFPKFGYPTHEYNVTLIKGDLRQTLAREGPEVAFAHVDVDWHESTLHALETLWVRLAAGGRILVDDYGHWSGCRAAVDEFLEGHDDAASIDTGLGSVVIVSRRR